MPYRENILATLAYYDIFDFPLKEEEVFRFLINLGRFPISDDFPLSGFDEMKAELEKLRSDRTINFSDGFYFLFERDYLVPLRLRREKIAREKWNKAFRAVRWLKFLPYIKAIFASGSLAMSNTEELGDLDVLVVVKRGRIWLSRLLISGLLSLIGVRRKYNEKVAPGKICLNHYITDKSLLIPHRSVYTAQTYINLKPIFISDPQIVYEFYKTNLWLSDYLINFNRRSGHFDMTYHTEGMKKLGRGFLAGVGSAAGEVILNSKLGDWLENWARRWQVKRIEEHKKQDPPGGRVVYNDDCLEFHPGSVETEIIEKYNQRLKKLGIDELAIERDSRT
jgi:hypothetical protein